MPAKNNILTPSILLLIGIGILVITLAAVISPGTSRQLRTGADLQGSCLYNDILLGSTCEYRSEAECRTLSSESDPERVLFLGDERSRYFWIANRRCNNPEDERFFSGIGESDQNYEEAIEACMEDPFTGLGNAECNDDESTGPPLQESAILEDAHGPLQEIQVDGDDSYKYVECGIVLTCSEAPSQTPTLPPTTTPTPKNTNKSAPQNTS